MIKLFTGTRWAAIVLLCAFLASCTQTAVSSYSGSIGSSVNDQRKAKIQAARKRAKANRAKREAAFVAKRQSARKGAKKSSKRSIKKSRKAKSVSKKKSRVSKSKYKKTKKVTSAFVGGRSKGISKSAPWKCVPGRLKKVINQVSKKFGRVTVSSTHRSRSRNRRAGGKKKSYHLRCQAVDFRVHGKTRGLTRWLARHPSVGGYKRYRAGFYHIDTGPSRTW